MYRTTPLFPYADGYYMIMPPKLPERFYPIEEENKFVTENYVICFINEPSEDIKQRLIKDYAEYHAKEKASGVFR